MRDLIFQNGNNTDIMGNNWSLLDFFMLISRVSIVFVSNPPRDSGRQGRAIPPKGQIRWVWIHQLLPVIGRGLVLELLIFGHFQPPSI